MFGAAIAGSSGKVPIVIGTTVLRRLLGALSLAFLAFGLATPSAHAQQGGDSVANRIDRLEQQFRDLQVSVGTLESLVRGKPGAVLQQETPQAPPGADANAPALGDLTARVGALETQIGALTSQIEQLGKQLADLQAKLAATEPQAPYPPSPPPAPAPGVPQPITPPVEQSEAPPAPPPAQNYAASEEDPSKPRWFGPAPGEPSGSAPGGSATQPLAQPSPEGKPSVSTGATAGIPNGDAQSLYEQGYGAMLQHDYGAAESAFRKLIASYPNDPLAGSAQYWIGESYFVRGQYKNAADAFLKGYKKYKSSDKAPDTLLKLGMSLAELGQKEAACSTFGELAKKFPQAPAQILDQAKGEREKAGCK